MHSNWRDCKAWEQAGLPLTTTSNEAAKMFDAVVTQYVGFYDDNSAGGMEGACKRMTEADPEFVMGQVVSTGFGILAWRPKHSTEFDNKIENMLQLCEKHQVHERERKHVDAVKLWVEGVWEDILVEHPTDMLALKFAYDSYCFLGYQPQIRDVVARVMPYWKPNMPLYSYLLGMHAYGLTETKFYEEADPIAKKGLEMNQCNIWATHALSHVHEELNLRDEGIALLNETMENWTRNNLSCHVYWHLALHYLEKNEICKVLEVYDNEIKPRLLSGNSVLMVSDACSLLLRLEWEGIDVGNRWSDVFTISQSHVEDHTWCFGDVHTYASCLRANKREIASKMMESMKEYIKGVDSDNMDVTRQVGIPLFEAFSAYDEGDFAKAVDIMHPIKYKIVKLGGSDAQRDVFNLFLINAALSSSNTSHQKLGRQLLLERKALKDNSPMTDRMIARMTEEITQ